MKNTATRLFSITIAIASALSSCVPQQKARDHKIQLTRIDSQLVTQKENLRVLDAKRLQKENANQIDDTASNRIKNYIARTSREIDTLIQKNTLLIGDVTIEVDQKDWSRLKGALLFSQKRENIISTKINFINDLLNRDIVVQLDQSLIFEAGKYTPNTGVKESIGKFFEPVAKEIDLFTKKYPDFPLSLVITAKGYADATTISEGSSLYRDLVEDLKLNSSPPDNKELNKQLSRKRAEAIIQLFKTFTEGRSIKGGNISNILFITEGKGEAYPNPKLTDYTADDPRRRVVLLFWSLFPE